MTTTQRDRAASLVQEHGTTFAQECGIAVERNTPAVLWQLLLMSHLLSSRISHELAVRATRQVRKDFRTPARLAAATQQQVHASLQRGHYLRTWQAATQLGETAELVLSRYRGDLRGLRTRPDPLAALTEFNGIGEVGAEVFLREVQGVWTELQPFAGDRALDQADRLGLPRDARRLAGLVADEDVPRLMAALVRSSLS